MATRALAASVASLRVAPSSAFYRGGGRASEEQCDNFAARSRRRAATTTTTTTTRVVVAGGRSKSTKTAATPPAGAGGSSAKREVKDARARTGARRKSSSSAASRRGGKSSRTITTAEAVSVADSADEADVVATPSSKWPRTIDLIVTDVDGTLLNRDQELTMRTEVAIARAAACGVPTVLATGKTRGPWHANAVAPKIPIPMPGVFIQGLLTTDADGTVLESVTLPPAIAKSIVRFADGKRLTTIAFCGSRILCAERSEETDLVLAYGEPAPEPVGDLVKGCVDAGIEINKLLLFASEEDMPDVRADAEAMFEGDVVVTTAVPGMLEFLPRGASKGAAVERLLKRLGVNPENVLALGDGENDVEMLRLAGVAVAMKGAGEKVIEAANGNVGLSNDDGGVADAIERYVLATRGLQPASEMIRESVDEDEDDFVVAAASEILIPPSSKSKSESTAAKKTPTPSSLKSPKAAAIEVAEKKKRGGRAKKAKAAPEAIVVEPKPATIEPAVVEEPEETPGGASTDDVAESLVNEVNARVAGAGAKNGAKKSSKSSSSSPVEVVDAVEVPLPAVDAARAEREAAAAAAVEEAKRMNAELLEASKAATARLAEMKDALRETEEELAKAEAAEAAEAKRRAEEEEARAASARGWGDEDDGGTSRGAASWEDRAADEQRAAVAAAAEAATARANAAQRAYEKAAAADAVRVAQAQREQGQTAGSAAAASSAQLPAWNSIGSFFAAALKTVSELTSPEARERQLEAERAAAKASVLAAVVSTNIGRDCDAAQLSAVEESVRRMEALNPTTTAPARSGFMRGRWSAVFTTSRQLLGMDKKLSITRQSGPVYFAHDVEEGRSEVQFTWPVKVDRAALEIAPDGRNLELTFEATKIFGLFGLPGSKKTREYSRLEVTYVDLDMMLCRGDNGTIYVMVQTNSAYRIGDTSSASASRQLS